MDTFQKRVEQLRSLIGVGKPYKNAAALAGETGLPDNLISRLLSNGPNRKRIGEKLARRIEQELKKPAFWLDGRDGQRTAESKTFYVVQATEEEAELGHEWGKLEEPARAQVRVMIELMVAAQVREGRKVRQGKVKPASGQKTASRPRAS